MLKHFRKVPLGWISGKVRTNTKEHAEEDCTQRWEGLGQAAASELYDGAIA